jgi:hypothetical protein
LADYILVATPLAGGTGTLTATKIIDELLDNKVWLLPPNSSYVTRIAAGDRFLIYAGKTDFSFYGWAESAGPLKDLDRSKTPNSLLAHRDFFQYMLEFRTVRRFQKPLDVHEILAKLSFVTNRRYWGLNFRRGIVAIPRKDFETILNRAT